MIEPYSEEIEELIPAELRGFRLSQNDIPRIAKDDRLMGQIESALYRVPTRHKLHLEDATQTSCLLP